MKRRLLTAALACAMLLPSVLPLAGCAAEDVEVLRVYNWEDYISAPSEGEDDSVDLIAEFEKDYEARTGRPIRVEYSTFGTNENMYNELKINPGAYDLVCPSDYMIMKMIDEGMAEPFSEAFLSESNYAKYGSPYIRDLFEANGWAQYAVPYMWGTMGFVYNPELSETIEQDLSGWAGLWEERYAAAATIKDSVRDSYFLGVAYVYRDELMRLQEEYDAADMTPDDEDYAAYNAKVTEIMNRTDEATTPPLPRTSFQKASRSRGLSAGRLQSRTRFSSPRGSQQYARCPFPCRRTSWPSPRTFRQLPSCSP